MNRIFKPLFLLAEPYRRTGRDVNSLFCSLFCCMKNPPLCGSARPESGWEARERSLMAVALASGFRFLRSFGIDRLDAPAHAAGRGSVGPDA